MARRTDLLSGFVVLSLVALLLAPLLIQREVGALRDEIEHAADPARTLVTEAQYLLARQTSVLRGYFITRHEPYLARFDSLQLREDSVYGMLEPLVVRLGDSVIVPFVELRTLSEQWHEQFDHDEIVAAPLRSSSQIAEIPYEQTVYLDALESATRLDRALASATAARQRRIAEAERKGMVANAVLSLLALAAATAVGYLSLRAGQLTREAESGRRIAEHALFAKDEAVMARARLLRGVTHDVKNPLGAADAYADLLAEGIRGPLSPDQLEFVGNIRRCIQSALAIIHDLLDLAGVEEGALPIQRTETDAVAVVDAAVDEYRAAIQRAGHALTVRRDAAVPALHTDPARVRQILGNLLSNAVKYTPGPGTIQVRIDVTDRRTPTPIGGWVAIRVLDSGPGIHGRDRDAVFDEFIRLDAGTPGGHGLGLAISRRIARLLGGDLTVSDSALGGAEFTLWLPLGGRNGPEGPLRGAAANQGGRKEIGASSR